MSYTCGMCGLVDVPVSVPARGAEDVVTWVQTTANICGANHILKSPHCPATSLDIRVPIEPSADRIGGPIRH